MSSLDSDLDRSAIGSPYTRVNATIHLDGDLEDESGLAASLVQGSTVIDGTQLVVADTSTLQCSFDLNSAPVGTYKVRVTNGCGTVVTSASDLFSVSCTASTPTSIDPPIGNPNMLVSATIHVDGHLMDGPVLAVSLVNGTTVVDGDQLAVVNATTLTCEFDLDSAPVGMYKIRVTTGCGTTATSVDDLFTVTCPPRRHCRSILQPPITTRS